MAVLSIDGVVSRNVPMLRNGAALGLWSLRLAEAIGMHPVGIPIIQPYAHWPDGAPSVVLFIEESAIILHSYPEASYIEITLHSCKAIPDHEGIATTIITLLGLDVRYFLYEEARNWRERAITAYASRSWPLALIPPG